MDDDKENMYIAIIASLLARLGSPVIMSKEEVRAACEKAFKWHISDDNMIIEFAE